MSGVTTEIITAAAVLDRSEAYQGLGLEVELAVGDREVVDAGCSVIVHLTGSRLMTV
jgi:hypothetical protein